MKITWTKLTTEKLECGDFWASVDPNTPEKQAQNSYNLQMQAVHPSKYGEIASNVVVGNGAFWRPGEYKSYYDLISIRT